MSSSEKENQQNNERKSKRPTDETQMQPGLSDLGCVLQLRFKSLFTLSESSIRFDSSLLFDVQQSHSPAIPMKSECGHYQHRIVKVHTRFRHNSESHSIKNLNGFCR